MLLIAISLGWLAISAMVLIVCRMAADADAHPDASSLAVGWSEAKESAPRPPVPGARAPRSAAARRWRAAHGLH